MKIKTIHFVYNDACETDGTQPESMFAVYEVLLANGINHPCRVPLSVPEGERRAYIAAQPEYQSPAGWWHRLLEIFTKP